VVGPEAGKRGLRGKRGDWGKTETLKAEILKWGEYSRGRLGWIAGFGGVGRLHGDLHPLRA